MYLKISDIVCYSEYIYIYLCCPNRNKDFLGGEYGNQELIWMIISCCLDMWCWYENIGKLGVLNTWLESDQLGNVFWGMTFIDRKSVV